MKIVSRAKAKEQGLKRYFTGKPCKRGHVCERQVSNKTCVQCQQDRVAKYQQTSENYRRYHKSYAHEWYLKNQELTKSRSRAWQQHNREAANASKAKWAKAHPELARYYVRLRQSRLLQRTPPWADLEAIKAFYESCPDGYHVDHYYPLQGESCSGLHVLENLRHIPAEENLSKGNKMPEVFYG